MRHLPHPDQAEERRRHWLEGLYGKFIELNIYILPLPIKLTSILGSHISWRFRDQGEVSLFPVFRHTHLVRSIRTHFALCSRFKAGKPYYVIGVDPSTGATMFGGKLGSAGFQSKNSLRLLVNGFIQFEDNSNESRL